ncbi:lipid droplet-associated hydrolase isoform X2 [Phalacrocorax carbo]|uniref:lipid droplet-associated hydrolase isoform X2 n=1 Tax=Phalacrocorax carbo TaxID=9209 RepID=UPI00311A659E
MTETEANPHDGCLGGPSLLLPPLPGGRRMPVPPGLGRPFPPERGPAAGAGEARPPQESRPPAPRTARRAAASLAERGGGGGRRSGAALSPPRAARAEGTAQPPPPPPPAAALRGLAGCFRPVSADLAAAAMLGAGEPAKGEANTRSASEEPVPLHEEFIYCCGAATHVLKCGPWKDLSKDESKNLPRLLFMIIPDTDIKELEDVFGLNGQVEHKLNFLKKNVSKDIKLVLIAHSIGCYITLEMMKRASELQVLRSVLLFPTIERMAQSPQGKLMTPLLCKLRYVLYMPVYLLSFLPEGVKASLVRFALRGMKTCDESSITTSVNLFSVDCIANILYMASQEMMKVVERDSTTIKQNLKKLIFYYGTGDSWCPQQYYDEIKMDFPDGDIRLCEKGLRHAFVLDASKEMAAMITDWLQDDLTKL